MKHILHKIFGGGNLVTRYHFQELHIDRRITLKRILKMSDAGMDLINLSQDMKRWRAYLNAVMNLRVP
jgi:hypothetical protein